jgi:hypothetical protein
VHFDRYGYPFITFWLECVATTLKSHVKRSSGYAQGSDFSKISPGRVGSLFFLKFSGSGRTPTRVRFRQVGNFFRPRSGRVGGRVGSKVGRILFKGSLKGSKFDLKKNWLDIARV